MNAVSDTILQSGAAGRAPWRGERARQAFVAPDAAQSASPRAGNLAGITENDAGLPRVPPLARRAPFIIDAASRHAYRLALGINFAVLGLLLVILALLT